jgi:LPS export ABC transporter protein LptC
MRLRAGGPCVLGLALLAAAGCGPAATRGPANGASSASPGAGPAAETTTVPVRIRGRGGSKYIYLTEQKKDRIVYKLRADSNTSIRLSEGNGISDFVRPHVTFYGDHGHTIIADAPHAQVAEREKTVTMTGGVRSRTNEGMTLTSDTLRYDDASEVLHGEGNVFITTAQGEHFSGQRMDYNLRTTEMHVQGSGPP